MKLVIVNLLRLLVFVAVFISACYFLAPKDRAEEIEDMPVQRPLRRYFTSMMAAQKPQVVLLGNSMLGRGVDERGFEILTGKKTVKFWTGGGASAWWYLTMKNVICQAETKPETVMIFFRDQYLTEPDFRVTGRSRPHMDDMCDGKEPLLQRIAYAKKMGPIAYLLYQHLPLYAKKDQVHTAIQNFIREKSTGILLGAAQGDAWRATKRTFSTNNMNQEMLTVRQLEAEKATGNGVFDFPSRLEHSFLPYIIQLAKENDINLVFVRVKMRRDIEPNNEPEELKEYISQLADYLKENDCQFQDYTHDTRLKLEHYADGDHLNPTSGMRMFTEILSRQSVPILTKKEKPNTSG